MLVRNLVKKSMTILERFHLREKWNGLIAKRGVRPVYPFEHVYEPNKETFHRPTEIY